MPRRISRLLTRAGATAGRGRRSNEKPPTTDVALTFRWCLENGYATRQQYLWGTLLGGRNAGLLGIERMTAIEFGVAGGNGLLALEKAAEATKLLTGDDEEIVGLATG